MGDFSRTEAAERAGLSLDAFSRLVELGILAPAAGDRFTKGQILAAELTQNLEAAGLPLEGIAAAIRSGALSLDFMSSPAYERFTALTDVTFAQLAEQTGIPLSLLMVVREAAGAALPSPDERVREGEMAIVPFIELQVKNGFRPPAVERLLRVHGDSLRRMAESEADWWRSEVIMPGIAAGKSVTAIATAEFARPLTEAAERAVIALYRAQQARAWTANIIEGFEMVLAQSGLHRPLERPPAMCFLDITGYTRLTAERGDAAAASLAEQLTRLVQRASVSRGGKPVKWLGDGVMFYFRDPGPGVVAALDMVDGVADAGLPPAHVGLHAGPVVFQEGDYYGQTVNVAARIAEYARPGEVLVSRAVVDAAADAEATFREIGPVELKGVGGPMDLYAAQRL